MAGKRRETKNKFMENKKIVENRKVREEKTKGKR
jgi:hypothetical protein